MLELLALLAVVAIVGLVVAGGGAGLEAGRDVVLLPFKLLFFPVVAIFAIVKIGRGHRRRWW